jgi:hypothetical protein
LNQLFPVWGTRLTESVDGEDLQGHHRMGVQVFRERTARGERQDHESVLEGSVYCRVMVRISPYLWLGGLTCAGKRAVSMAGDHKMIFTLQRPAP